MNVKQLGWSAIASSLVFLLPGCSNMPGTAGQQGAVIGGASGAAVGAAVSKNRALGAVIGGAVGAAGGYVVGQNKDKIFGHDDTKVKEATRNAQTAPATPDEARNAANADVNGDGFVTMDEIVAMRAAGLSDDEMIRRMEATGQVFTLTDDQKDYLRNQGVSQRVIDQMLLMNKTATVPAPNVPNPDVIGKPR
jgi:hypothetical protein